MKWKIEEAQQKFSEIIRGAVAEPQLIYHQDKVVAAVVEAEIFQEFLVWQSQHRKPSLGNAFAELRQLCAEENYSLEVPTRENRLNPFVEILCDISL